MHDSLVRLGLSVETCRWDIDIWSKLFAFIPGILSILSEISSLWCCRRLIYIFGKLIFHLMFQLSFWSLWTIISLTGSLVNSSFGGLLSQECRKTLPLCVSLFVLFGIADIFIVRIHHVMIVFCRMIWHSMMAAILFFGRHIGIAAILELPPYLRHIWIWYHIYHFFINE